LRALATLMSLGVLAGCGGGAPAPPQLFDGSTSPDVPDALSSLEGVVMTTTSMRPASVIDPGDRAACGLFPASAVTDGLVVRRVGVNGASVTFEVGSSLRACDTIPDPAADPDRPEGSPWCGGSFGRFTNERLLDPRLDLCTAAGGALTAFAWVEPTARTEWVVVRDGGRREVYATAGSLPVRVTTVDGVDADASRAAFEIEEYERDGHKLREYTLRAAVAG
jgi:hypothetical protein